MTLELSSLHFVFACDVKTLSALRFVFAYDATTSRALFCVCLYSNNLARSDLSLFVTQRYNLARSILYLLATLELIAHRFAFVCDATQHVPLCVSMYSYTSPHSVLSLLVQLQLGAQCSVFACRATTYSLLQFVFACDTTT